MWLCAPADLSRHTVPFIMFCWGIVMISMAFVNNFAGLLVYVADPSDSFCQCLTPSPQSSPLPRDY